MRPNQPPLVWWERAILQLLALSPRIAAIKVLLYADNNDLSEREKLEEILRKS